MAGPIPIPELTLNTSMPNQSSAWGYAMMNTPFSVGRDNKLSGETNNLNQTIILSVAAIVAALIYSRK